MKRIVACIILVCLLCSVRVPIARGDMIPPVPGPPEIPQRLREERQADRYPIYAVAAGVVAVALTGSLIALRRIRKRSGR
jgi:hypothetical protein